MLMLLVLLLETKVSILPGEVTHQLLSVSIQEISVEQDLVVAELNVMKHAHKTGDVKWLDNLMEEECH